jgi:hypothetical protein
MITLIKYLPSVLFLFVLGCNSPAKKEHQASHAILAKGKMLTEEFGGCDTVLNKGVSVVIRVWEPSDSTEVSTQIREIITGKVIDRINSYSDSASIASNPTAKTSTKEAYNVFAGNYKSFEKEFPDAPGCWEVEVSGDTVMMTSNLLLYQFDHYSFTGGAHPNSFRSYHVFDLQTGKEADAKKFVSDTVALLKKVESAFRKEEKLDSNVNMEDAGYFLTDHQFFIPANYTFTREGVFFYYNPYEIAAYVRGPITFTIPYSELKGIVNKELIF